MAHQPTPILIVSASTNRADVFNIYDALAAGAVDVLEKPTGREPDGAWERRLLCAAKIAARVKVITHLGARAAPLVLAADAQREREQEQGWRSRRVALSASGIVAIGASTGGPGAIVEVLRALPDQFDVPILIVMHISEPFGAMLAEWLESRIDRKLVTPEDGASVVAAAGQVVLASWGRHLVVRGGRMFLTHDDARHSCRPSIDVLFESVAADYRSAAAGCLLTGMGKDGALGLLKMREAGGLTVAQDQDSSVIYGMPREARRLEAAAQVLPLREIGLLLSAWQESLREPAT